MRYKSGLLTARMGCFNRNALSVMLKFRIGFSHGLHLISAMSWQCTEIIWDLEAYSGSNPCKQLRKAVQ